MIMITKGDIEEYALVQESSTQVSWEIRVVYSLIVLEAATIPNIVALTNIGRSSVINILTVLEKPLPNGLSVEIAHIDKRKGYTIKSYGLLDEVKVREAAFDYYRRK